MRRVAQRLAGGRSSASSCDVWAPRRPPHRNRNTLIPRFSSVVRQTVVARPRKCAVSGGMAIAASAGGGANSCRVNVLGTHNHVAHLQRDRRPACVRRRRPAGIESQGGVVQPGYTAGVRSHS